MAVGDIGIFAVTGDLAGPVEQREVEQTVDDVAVVFRRAHLAPGLDELALGLEAGHQLVGSLDGGYFAQFAAGQFVGRHAGRAVQKAHVVVVHLDFMVDAVGKAFHQGLGGVAEGFVAGALVGQPDFPGPETAGPLVVFAGGVDAGDAGMVLALVRVERQVDAHLGHGTVQRSGRLFVGHNGKIIRFHTKHLIQKGARALCRAPLG